MSNPRIGFGVSVLLMVPGVVILATTSAATVDTRSESYGSMFQSQSNFGGRGRSARLHRLRKRLSHRLSHRPTVPMVYSIPEQSSEEVNRRHTSRSGSDWATPTYYPLAQSRIKSSTTANGTGIAGPPCSLTSWGLALSFPLMVYVRGLVPVIVIEMRFRVDNGVSGRASL